MAFDTGTPTPPPFPPARPSSVNARIRSWFTRPNDEDREAFEQAEAASAAANAAAAAAHAKGITRTSSSPEAQCFHMHTGGHMMQESSSSNLSGRQSSCRRTTSVPPYGGGAAYAGGVGSMRSPDPGLHGPSSWERGGGGAAVAAGLHDQTSSMQTYSSMQPYDGEARCASFPQSAGRSARPGSQVRFADGLISSTFEVDHEVDRGAADATYQPPVDRTPEDEEAVYYDANYDPVSGPQLAGYPQGSPLAAVRKVRGASSREPSSGFTSGSLRERERSVGSYLSSEPPPAETGAPTRAVSLKELSHLRSLISAGMDESEAHRVLEAARDNLQAREHLENVLRAQGSGPYESDGTGAAYNSDPRLRDLEGLEDNEGLSVHTWPPRGGVSLDADFTRALSRSGRVRGGADRESPPVPFEGHASHI